MINQKQKPLLDFKAGAVALEKHMISISKIIYGVNEMTKNDNISEARKDQLVMSIICLIVCTGFGFLGLFFYGLAKLFSVF